MTDWSKFTEEEKKKPYYRELYEFVKHEYNNGTCYPAYENIFKALEITGPDDVKCVILGQDPYHEPNQAMGLSFSVNDDVPIPRSLQNIYKELNDELGCRIPNNGNLISWAEQGVLMLNSVLTVQAHKAGSHAEHGWETYTDAVLRLLNEQQRPIVYMLWGNYAKNKAQFLNNSKQLVLKAAHPSPFSASSGFFGCGHFKKCNEFLEANGIQPIDWQIKDI
jgi:uracil-DNA glycosylase